MGKLKNIGITGTVGNICFYEMNGQFYARSKTSLTGKRMKRDPAFQQAMLNAGLFGRASVIASVVYRLLPAKEKGISKYRNVTGMAMRLLKGGMQEEEVLQRLKEEWLT